MIKNTIRINNCFYKKSLEKKGHIVSGRNKETGKRNRETLWSRMPFIRSHNCLRKNGTNSARKNYTMNIDC
jgi:hypothetical protein